MTYIDTHLAASLEREASLFSARNRELDDASVRTFIVADLEFRYDRDAHAAFEAVHGTEARRGIRWPFHQIATICWLTLRFTPGETVPDISPPTVLSADRSSQREMAEAFFAALDSDARAALISWGGEARDFAVLRHLACSNALVLPVQLRNSSPSAFERIDLCREVTALAEKVHLHEYAAASGVPSKPSPADQIGHLAEADEWDAVRDHCLADVATIAILAMRHLHANGIVDCVDAQAAMTLSDAVGRAFPESAFWRRDLNPWTRDRLRSAGLRGVVFRAEADA